ncbi:hypothetical protein ACFX1R_000654 [Malus domestica]
MVRLQITHWPDPTPSPRPTPGAPWPDSTPGSFFHLFRHHSIWLGSILSLLAGASKEFVDELEFFRSTTDDAKDTVADLMGVLIGSMLLYLIKYVTRPEKETSRIREVSSWEKMED